MPNDAGTAFRVEVEGGIAEITFDLPGRPVNVIHEAFFAEISEIIERVDSDPGISAAIIGSGKRDNFVAGADLDLVRSFSTAEKAAAFIRDGHTLLNRIADSPKRWVAAIHGAAMGGGLELALACHARVATDHPSTVLALPEVMVGLIPAGGGTQRLPALIGLPDSLSMMLTGARIRARKAKATGLVDELCPPDELRSVARTIASSPIAHSIPFSRSGTLFPVVRSVILSSARRKTLERARGLYPAPLGILGCVSAGMTEGFEAGLAKEEETFARLATGREARNLIWIFNATAGLKKRPTPKARAVSRLGILGAGLMGEGIASVSLPFCEVVLEDISDGSLAKATGSIERRLEKRAASGAITTGDHSAQRQRLTTTTSVTDLAGSDLVIEAVFEDLELKKGIFDEAARVCGEGTILASNTSAIPIRSIAADIPRPDRFVGMHYFSPVPKMPLLEIVRTDGTSEEALDTAVAFGVKQGKTPIVVGDGPGFYTTRILAPLINEAMILVEEGVSPVQIDEAMKNAGFPVGPITLLDEVGIDVAAHVSDTLGKAFAARGHRPSSAMKRLVEEGILGRKSGEGFYIWRRRWFRGSKHPGHKARKIVRKASRQTIEHSEIVDRCLLSMVNEAAYCLDENIVRSPLEGDIGAVLGLGFPPLHAGPFHYLDRYGPKAIVSRLRELARTHGDRFEPAPPLVEMAETKRHYYQ